MKKIVVNMDTGVSKRVDLTVKELAQKEAREEAAIAVQQAEADAKIAQDTADAQKATDKASGNQKLLDLGLSQNEVDALTT